MKIKEASEFLNSLISETDNTSEIKVYKKFMAALASLESKSLTDLQIKSIEDNLDSLQLKSPAENRKKYFRKKLSELYKFLKDQFSFVPKGYYTGMGIGLGMSFGVAFGAALQESLGVSFGLIIGMFVGIIIGTNMDATAKKEGRVFSAE